MERIQVLYYLAKALSVAVFLRWKNTIFGIHPSLEIVWQKALDVEWAGLPGHSGFSWTMGCCNGRWGRWPFVFTLVFHCMWVLKGRKDASEQVYRLGRGGSVHGIRNALDLEWARSGSWIAQISDEWWGAAAGDEVAARVHGVFPLPMGIEREDRCEWPLQCPRHSNVRSLSFCGGCLLKVSSVLCVRNTYDPKIEILGIISWEWYRIIRCARPWDDDVDRVFLY